MRVPEERGIQKALYGQAVGRRPQCRPNIRSVDNVRQGTTSLGVRNWESSARDHVRWKALVEDAVGLPCRANGIRVSNSVLKNEN